MKKSVILYNPRAPYYTMPLQFLALAALIDRSRYDIHIIDARIEKTAASAHQKVLALLGDAVCVGISVITGTPIRDAMELTGIVKRARPDLPVIWGGWHPSIYPEQCIREGGADFCVIGQGEVTFRELLSFMDNRASLSTIPGVAFLENGALRITQERKFTDINEFPPYDYGLLPLETYFRLKRNRSADFYSSQGCPYRCAFCADPYVYKRRWSGLSSDRMIADVSRLVRSHGITDVVFQDENFFANQHRALEFCDGISGSGLTFSWTATSRADQIACLDETVLRQLAKSGLRNVIIGAESGSPEILKRITKDTLAEEAIISAEKLSNHGIGAAFGFIVGFPDESQEDTRLTLDTIRIIKRINPHFEANIFYFTPYPGTELFSHLVKNGYTVPQTILEWCKIDFITYAGYWLKKKERRELDRFRFYSKLATEKGFSAFPFSLFRGLARYRFSRGDFRFPLEMKLTNLVRHTLLRRMSW